MDPYTAEERERDERETRMFLDEAAWAAANVWSRATWLREAAAAYDAANLDWMARVVGDADPGEGDGAALLAGAARSAAD